ncbi:MAG: ATP-binding cassette domain-containing protein, partial [Thermoplasmata archaeon]|nr:ATP-binding cassette domain-containing protein [Thermoplasmata archaeon]
MSSEPLLSVHALSTSWGRTPVLRDISLEVQRGEFVVLMGPNGSGKTTLLRSIAGFQRSDAGSIRVGGRSIDDLPPHRRGIGMLFQDAALFPRRTAWENVAYGLEIAHRGPSEVEARVRELFELLHLGGLEARTSDALSGGERQRVALARTLAPGPSLVLLDEPFAAV